MFVKELLLEKYQINPIPIVVELDQHPNGLQLQRHIGAITGRKTVPNVHILSTSRGGGDEFRALEAEGNVISQIKQWANDKVLIEKIVV